MACFISENIGRPWNFDENFRGSLIFMTNKTLDLSNSAILKNGNTFVVVGYYFARSTLSTSIKMNFEQVVQHVLVKRDLKVFFNISRGG